MIYLCGTPQYIGSVSCLLHIHIAEYKVLKEEIYVCRERVMNQ